MTSIDKYWEQVKRSARSLGDIVNATARGKYYCHSCESFVDSREQFDPHQKNLSCPNCGERSLVLAKDLEWYRDSRQLEERNDDTLPPWLK